MRLYTRILIVASSIGACAGCGMGAVPVSTVIPDPLVQALPLTVAVIYDEDFSRYTYEEKATGADWSIDLGDTNVRMLDRVLSSTFASVVRRDAMPAEGESLAGIDLVLKPEIDEYAFLTPEDSGVDFYSVSIRYNLVAFTPNGAPIDRWQINSYGRTKAKKISPKDSLAAATDVALRDAAAALALDFQQRPQILALLPGAPGNDGSETETTQTR
jgi:hypothetical protein